MPVYKLFFALAVVAIIVAFIFFAFVLFIVPIFSSCISDPILCFQTIHILTSRHDAIEGESHTINESYRRSRSINNRMIRHQAVTNKIMREDFGIWHKVIFRNVHVIIVHILHLHLHLLSLFLLSRSHFQAIISQNSISLGT